MRQSPCATSCATCDGMGNCECCCEGHWLVGVDALFLSPTNNNHALNSFQFLNADMSVAQQWNADGGHDFIATPRVTIGYQGECWGVEMRYWRMDDVDTAGDLAFANGAGTLSQVRFRAETTDLEVTRQLCRGDTQMLATFGVRYAQLDQFSGLTVNQFANAGADYYSGSVLDHQGFHGAGLTGSLSGVRPLSCDSCWNLFWSGRASLLWDNDATDSVQTFADFERNGVGFARAYDAATASTNASLFIGEIEIGLQRNFYLPCIHANAFVRGAFEYQYWSTDGCAGAAAVSGAGIGGYTQGHAMASAGNAFGSIGGDSHTNLVGFTIGTGITW